MSAANPKYYNAKADAGDEDVDAGELLLSPRVILDIAHEGRRMLSLHSTTTRWSDENPG
jgi:hypothetical protein